MLTQILSLGGAILLLFAFTAHQLQRIDRDGYSYQILNAAGGFALLIVAIGLRNWGLILLEGFWTAVSLYGLFRIMKPKLSR